MLYRLKLFVHYIVRDPFPDFKTEWARAGLMVWFYDEINYKIAEKLEEEFNKYEI